MDKSSEIERLKALRQTYLVEEKINYVCKYLQSDAAWDKEIYRIFRQCFGDPDARINTYQRDGHMFNHNDMGSTWKVKDFKPVFVRMSNKNAVKQGLYKIYSVTSRVRLDKNWFDKEVTYLCYPEEKRDPVGSRKFRIDDSDKRLTIESDVELRSRFLSPIMGKTIDEILKNASNNPPSTVKEEEREVFDTLAHELSHAAVGTWDYIVCHHYNRAKMLEVDEECVLKQPFTSPATTSDLFNKIKENHSSTDKETIAERFANYNKEEIDKGERGWPIYAIENASNWGFFIDMVLSYLGNVERFRYIKEFSTIDKNYKIFFYLQNNEKKGIYIQKSGDQITSYLTLNSEAYITTGKVGYPSPYIFKASIIKPRPKTIYLMSAPSDYNSKKLYLNYRSLTGKVKLYDEPLAWEVQFGIDRLIRLYSTEANQYMGLWGEEPYVRESMKEDLSSHCIDLQEAEVFPLLRIKCGDLYIGREDTSIAPACNQLLYMKSKREDAEIFLPIHVTDDIVYFNSARIMSIGGRTEIEPTNLWLNYRDLTGAAKLYDEPLPWLMGDIGNGRYSLKSLRHEQYMGLWDDEPYVRGCYNPKSSDAQFTFERVNTEVYDDGTKNGGK